MITEQQQQDMAVIERCAEALKAEAETAAQAATLILERVQRCSIDVFSTGVLLPVVRKMQHEADQFKQAVDRLTIMDRS
jgi:hypothetical protein